MSYDTTGQGEATTETQTPQVTDPNEQQQDTDASATPSVAGLSKEAAREAIRKHKVKVDGQELEVDDEELKRGYAHQKAANKRLQEGMAAKKQAEEFIKMMKDPAKVKEVMTKLGYTREQIRKMSEEVLAAELEEELMDPRERDLRDAKMRLQKYEELEKAQREAKQKKIDEAMKKKYSEEFSAKFVDALKTEKLPPTKPMVAEMAKYIHRAAKLNFEMTPQEAAKLVKEDIERSYQNLYGESDAETLARLLGEQNLQKIRQYDTSRLKDPNAGLKTPQIQGEAPNRTRSSNKPMSAKEWRDFNRK